MRRSGELRTIPRSWAIRPRMLTSSPQGLGLPRGTHAQGTHGASARRRGGLRHAERCRRQVGWNHQLRLPDQLVRQPPEAVRALVCRLCRLQRPLLRSRPLWLWVLLSPACSQPLPTPQLVLRPSLFPVRQEGSGLWGSVLEAWEAEHSLPTLPLSLPPGEVSGLVEPFLALSCATLGERPCR